jgi:hypothetical protein
MNKQPFMSPCCVSVPSWVIPGTYVENLKFIAEQPEIGGVELLFFIYDDEIEKQFDDELPEIRDYAGRFVFTAHLPENLKDEHAELVEKLLPFVRHFIVHPPKDRSAAESHARLINGWADDYGNPPGGFCRFLAENTNPGLLENLLPLLNDRVGLCMDTGHLLIEGRNPAGYFSQRRGGIAEIHLHGLDREKAAVDGRLPDHRPVKEDAPWFRELFPLLEDFNGVLNLEVFSWGEAAQSIAAIKRMGGQ